MIRKYVRLNKRKNKLLDPKKSIGYQWMNRGEFRKDLYKNLIIDRVEIKDVPLSDYDRILKPYVMIDFLERYYSEPNLDWKDTDYWHHLLGRYTGNHVRELEEKDFIRAHNRLKTFIKLCENIKKWGWSKKNKNNFSGSHVAILVAKNKYSDILFNTLEMELILDNSRDRKKLIDGHHRLACAYYLGLNKVPTCLHHVDIVQKWYQPKDALLNGIIPNRYIKIQNILNKTAMHKNVLDVGCNTGLVSMISSKAGASKVIGIDKRENLTERAIDYKNIWIEKKFVKKNNIEFKNVDLNNNLEILNDVNYLIFLRVLYHLGQGVENIFESIKNRKDMVILIQGNNARAKKAEHVSHNYGNKLAIKKNIIKFLSKYNFTYIEIDSEIIFAYHKESEKKWEKKKIFDL